MSETVQVEVSNLQGAALDWAVAKCEFGDVVSTHSDPKAWPESRAYSTDWSHAGPIIAREMHAFDHMQSDRVCAILRRKDMRNGGWEFGYGSTPLIAAMRCYVTAKLGPTIEVPAELLSEPINTPKRMKL